MTTAYKKESSSTLAYAGLCLAPLFWAGNAVLARAVVNEIPPVSLAFWRWLIAFIILLPIGLPAVIRQWQTIKSALPQLTALSIFSIILFSTSLYEAALTTTAINIAIINATIPIAIIACAYLILRQSISLPAISGILLAIVGVLLIVTQGHLLKVFELSYHIGDLIMVAAVVCWGLYSVLMKWFDLKISLVALLTSQIAIGVLILLPVLLVDVFWLGGGFEFEIEHAPTFAYVAIFPSIGSYMLWSLGVREVGPSKSGIFMYLIPVFAAILSWFFIDESLEPFHIYGGLLVMMGLCLGTMKRVSLQGAWIR